MMDVGDDRMNMESRDTGASGEDVIRIHIWFSGRVQGVFFRHHTEKKARELGVYGWVMNLPDGRVEAVFEGKKEDVEELLEYCSKRQPLAWVEGVETTEETPEGLRTFVRKHG